MKMTISLAVLIGLLGSAMAQPFNSRTFTSGDIAPTPYIYVPIEEGYNASAQVQKVAPVESNIVRDSGQSVIGADPDVNIRGQLLRDHDTY